VVLILWGYRQDKRDEINYDMIRSEKNKLYCGLYLDPIMKAEKYDKKTEKLYSTTK
jgi:hypothetical protein